MGRGDKKTRRGKIWRGSHGKTRPKHTAPSGPPKPAIKEQKKTK